MRRIILGLAFAVLAVFVARVDAAEKIKIHFVEGGGHDWKGNFKILRDILEKMGDFEITQSADLDALKAETIKSFDAVLFYGSGLNFPDGDAGKEQEKGLCDFIASGHAFVGIHSATDAFKKSQAYWELIGGQFAGHGGGKFPVRIYDKEHPITKGLEDFEIQDETYSHNYHKNMVIRALIRMDRGKEQQCMGWVQPYGKGRVFYSALGHGREAWTNPAFQRFVVRGIYWAVGRELKDPPAPEPANK